MPFPRNDPGLKDWRSHRNFDQSDDGHRRENRRGTVHHDAKRTMIGVADFLVGMGYLRNCQQC